MKHQYSKQLSSKESNYSLLQIGRTVNGEEKFIFYIIPAKREDDFVYSPGLVDTSLDAKSFYEIDCTSYNTNQESYDQEIDNLFDNLTKLMGGSSDH